MDMLKGQKEYFDELFKLENSVMHSEVPAPRNITEIEHKQQELLKVNRVENSILQTLNSKRPVGFFVDSCKVDPLFIKYSF